MKKFIVGFVLGLCAVGLLWAQEPARFERGIEMIRGNLSVGTGSIIFEGATGDAFETTLSAADVTADVTLTLPLSGAASAAFLVSTLTTNSVDVANSIWGTSNNLALEGATANAFESFITTADVTADVTLTIATGSTGTIMVSTLATNAPDIANSVWGASANLVFEGATADAVEAQIQPVDPTVADGTYLLPDAGVTAALAISTLSTNNIDAANSIWLVSNGIVFEGATANANETTINVTDPAADGTLNFTYAGQAAGEQLQTDGAGVLTWEAAASVKASKHLEGLLSPREGLEALLDVPVYRFHYKRDPGLTTTGDYDTQYVGLLAEDAPWAMHHRGRILNPVNTFGYTVLAIQALEARITELERAR